MTRPVRSAAERYEHRRELGRGGMGAVDLVWDALRGEEVARKRCHRIGREAFVRLKREFRALSELRHPSLVTVHELARDEEGVFFTMEVIDGVDLLTFCRGGGHAAAWPSGVRTVSPLELDATIATPTSRHPGDETSVEPTRRAPGELDLGRLAAVLPSVVEGLAYLHARGLVHRDLKPSNILVERDGRARIVDFGILAELSAKPGDIAGTPAYMAPEQIRGAPPTPASDLYALGVILFELVAGRPPFEGEPLGLFGQHLGVEPPPLGDVAAEAPEPIAQMVQRLLAKEPGARPGIAEVATTLLPALGAGVPELETADVTLGDLVGRAAVQARMHDVLVVSEHFGALVLEGPTGVGKTSLARWAADDAARRGWAVLDGRARPSELIAYNAVDGVVDELAAQLGPLDGDEALERAASRAAVAFPALGEAPHVDRDPVTARAEAFEGLVTLLEALAARRGGVLVVVDDLQWADSDSVACLDALATAAPAGARILATLRDDLPESVGSRWIDRTEGVHRLAVPPLDETALATIAVRASGGQLDPSAVPGIAAACAGRAYYAEVAGRLAREPGGAATDLQEALARRLGAMDEAAHRALAALAAAEGWLRAADLAAVLDTHVGAVDVLARELAALALVRRTGTPGPDEEMDLYHDVAREAVMDAVGSEGLRDGHAALATHLEKRTYVDPLRVVRHMLGAGRETDAARRAVREAGRAERRQAFALAAELYEIAARGLPDEAAALRRKRATAFIRAGRYHDAADLLASLPARDATDRIDLTFDQAYARLMGGAIAEGRADLDRVLVSSGTSRLPRGLGGLVTLVRAMAGPPRPASPRGDARADARSLEQREREAEVALLLTWEDPAAAIGWALRARSLGDRVGRPERGAFADYVLAFMAVASNARAGEVALANRYLESARRRAAPIADEPIIRALDGAVPALHQFRLGQFADAAERFAALARELETAGRARTHVHLLLLSNTCGALLSAERVLDLVPALERFEASCPEAQGAMAAHTQVIRLGVHVFRGERSSYHELRRRVREAYEPEPRLHHVLHEVICAAGDLLWSDPLPLRRRLAQAMREARRFRPMRSYFAGSLASNLALVEAAALRAGDRGASRRRIERWAKIARAAPPLSIAGAVRASAYAAELSGEDERAVALLEEAEQMAERWGQEVSRSIARYQRGRRIGGDEGAALMEDARRRVVAAGGGVHLLQEVG